MASRTGTLPTRSPRDQIAPTSGTPSHLFRITEVCGFEGDGKSIDIVRAEWLVCAPLEHCTNLIDETLVFTSAAVAKSDYSDTATVNGHFNASH